MLKLKHVGLNDNFFDIGGHSLLAVQIMTRIENKTGRKLPIATLFKYPTVGLLNAFIQKEQAESGWKSLVPIKASGSKIPLYIVHGAGLNVLNFSSLALYVDPEQPVFGLQARGLDGVEEPMDSITGIARSYVQEILEHNPDGPYAIAGYSIGGFIAVEMARYLEQLNKQVKMLAIFDTDAEDTVSTEKWHVLLPKKIKRYMPAFLGGTKSLTVQLVSLTQRKVVGLKNKFGPSGKPESKEFYKLLDKLQAKYVDTLSRYKLEPYDGTVHLFKAEIYDHYNNDVEYMGWRKYALKGVNRYLVAGNHLSMLLTPSVITFASVLQNVLDNV